MRENLPINFRLAYEGDFRYFYDLILNEPVNSEVIRKNLGLLGYDGEYFKCTDWKNVFVAEFNGKKIGFVSITGGNSNGFNYIGIVYVIPEYRRRGIGTQLIKYAFNYSVFTWNAVGVDIYTIENEPMDRLLHMLGFSNDGSESKHYYVNGKFIGQRRWIKLYEHIPEI